MNQSNRVGGGEGFEALAGEGGEKIERHRVGELVDILARDIFHHDEGLAFGAEEVVDGDDVRVLEARELAGFEEGIGDAVGGFDLLDGDPAV